MTLLVYYSGSVHSWFWAMYLLIIIEAAFLLERDSEERSPAAAVTRAPSP